ncbi:hypothetical protein GCM10023235_65540 [Kitasatospora terrestris]|uniref:Uncharacterized protein n=1 Tax=Kitasatospora terrestris TaxID=258051 RepID=A0ABP9EH44_9ACTN
MRGGLTAAPVPRRTPGEHTGAGPVGITARSAAAQAARQRPLAGGAPGRGRGVTTDQPERGTYHCWYVLPGVQVCMVGALPAPLSVRQVEPM